MYSIIINYYYKGPQQKREKRKYKKRDKDIDSGLYYYYKIE